MTSLIPGLTPGTDHTAATARITVTADPRHRRPLVLLATLGGVLAAGSVLLVCLALGEIGWFASDAGSHGAPRDGLRVGAVAWLMAHGSGVHVQGTAVTVVPLLLTLVAAWATWRVGHRVGDSISGHGPDADALADGARDWTVPVAAALFAGGYAAVTVVTCVLADSPALGLGSTRAVGWSLVVALLFGGPGLAVGAGRAAIWATFLPPNLRATVATCRTIVVTFLLASTVVLVAALVLDLGTAANVLAELHLSTGESVLFLLVTGLLVPNASLFSGSYLLGPGFTVGSHTLVTTSVVVIGPLPMFPLLAALPDPGTPPSWTVGLLAVPVVVAAVAAAWAQRRRPTIRWEDGAIRGCAGGVLAGALTGILMSLAGGAVGPGRMAQVGPFAFDAFAHAVTVFGLGGLLGGLAMTWWQRRAARAAH